MKKLLLTILISLLAFPAHANDPKKTYHEQQKYQKMFCILMGIPVNRCRGKKK